MILSKWTQKVGGLAIKPNYNMQTPNHQDGIVKCLKLKQSSMNFYRNNQSAIITPSC